MEMYRNAQFLGRLEMEPEVVRSEVSKMEAWEARRAGAARGVKREEEDTDGQMVASGAQPATKDVEVGLEVNGHGREDHAANIADMELGGEDTGYEAMGS